MTAPATPPLAHLAYEELKHRITRSILLPGQWLTEKGLADDLGLGLTPVRVALARLTNEGLLLTLPRRGYQVSTLTLKAADDLFATWKLLACEIMRLATLNMTPEALVGYEEVARRARTRSAAGGLDEVDVWLQNAREKWQFFATVADNDYLNDIYLRLDSQLSRLFSLTFSSALEVGFSERRHRAFTRMLRERDAAAVVKETTTFLEMAHRGSRRALTNSKASAVVELTG